MTIDTPQRQTPSYLMNLFKEVGFRPDVRRGQNFLIDLNLVHLIHETAQLEANDVVLEVGTGTASLTAAMAGQAGSVVTVEIDSALYRLAQEHLIPFDNVTLLHFDALKNKNQLNAELLEVVRDRLARQPNARFKLVANLPFQVATPVISNLLASDIPPASMTVTIQKELADRFCASPGTKDYGALSVWIQSQCRVTLVRVLPPSVFWPRPKVHSAIVHIELDHDRRADIPDLAFFHHFVRAVFFHRRKFLRRVLHAAFKSHVSKPEIDEIMQQLDFDANTRAETLDIETIKKLSEAFRAKAPEWRL